MVNKEKIPIIKQIEDNYIKKTKYINNIIDNNKKYKIDFFKSGKNKLLGILYNNKLLIAGNYNFYGIYQINTNLWIWASSIPGVDLKHVQNINKIKNLSHLFENYNDPQANFYYQLLTQDVLLISNDTMLEWINKLLVYLSDDIYHFNPINSEQNIQFINISSIKEKYI